MRKFTGIMLAVAIITMVNFASGSCVQYWDARHKTIDGQARMSGDYWNDRTGNGHTATLGSTASFVLQDPAPAAFGGVPQDALVVDSTPAVTWSVTGNSGIGSVLNGFTLEALIRCDTSDAQIIFGNTGDGVGQDRMWAMEIASGKIRFNVFLSNAGWVGVSSDSTVVVDEWMSVVGVFDSEDDNTLRLYINGVAQTETQTSTNNINAAEGILTYGIDVQSGDLFDGSLGYVKLYDEGLTASNVSDSYSYAQNYFTVPEPATLGLLCFGGFMALMRKKM